MKTDILREIMYFSYDQGSFANLYPLAAEDVLDIIRMNRRGEKPESLKTEPEPSGLEFVTAVGDDSITRFDETRKKRKKNNRGRQQNRQNMQNRSQKPGPQRQGDKKGNERQNS